MAWSTIGNLVGNLGGALNLPEFGISERINSIGYQPTNWNTTNPINQTVQAANNAGSPIQANQIGSVLGSATTYRPPAPTNNTSGSPTYTQPSQPAPQPTGQVQEQQAPQRDYYAEISGVFDELLGSLGGQQSQSEGMVRTAADTQRAGIQEQLGYGMQSLDQNRGRVRENQVSTLSDLAQNMRDSAQNVGRYLGARGAGNSSAQEAGSFALQKMFGKERGSVLRQGNEQLGEIDLAETNLKAKSAEMLNGVETWANTQMQSIAQQFNDLRNNIGQMKGTMRAQAIESLWNQANQVSQMKQQYAMAIQQQAQDRLAQLNNMKMEMGNAAKFDPRAMVFQEYGFNPQGSQRSYSDPMFNPLALARRKEDERL